MYLVFVTIVILLLAFASPAWAEDLIVGGGTNFRTISEAVNAARDGDRIIVSAGVYKENVFINKSVVLEGSDSARVIGTGVGSVITVAADNCTIRGLQVEHGGTDLQSEDAGILLRSNGNVVENNILVDVLFGIYLYHSHRNSVRSNKITGRPELEAGERGAGLHLWNSSDNTLESNVISYTRDGMYVQSSPRNVMTDNRVSKLRYGLHFMNSDDNRFERNVFHDNVAGAAIMYSVGIVLRQNAFLHNRGFSSFGILFQDCRKCVAEENLIANNATGVFLEALRDSVIRRNTISENDVAAQVFSSSENNVFTENNFIANISPLMMIGKSTSTAWSTDSVGNYWSDYAGYDVDGNGVGDIPHKLQNIFEYLESNYPRLRLFLDSPAAQSMVAAERSFPIIEGTNQFDRKPIMRRIEIDFATELPHENAQGSGMVIASFFMLGVSLVLFRWGARP